VINWTPYLESVCKKYAQWWDVYTLTDVAGKMRSPNTASLLMDLWVQAVQEPREGREGKTEPYGVLEELRKYAADHVLLVGRPGSGKSMALAQLLFEESNKARDLLADEENKEKIILPILLELRYCKTSIVDLILKFLKRHELIINNSDLDNILLGKTNIIPLLLFDGLNELSDDDAREEVKDFLRENEDISMVFTTRDIEIGGDFNIEKKLEILPLTQPQMQQFVLTYFPEFGQQVLRKLGTRLREFGETPLLLWMLCFVFATNGEEIPTTSGLLFREFAKKFDKKKKKTRIIKKVVRLIH
jgi:predicted NACHT family NTPase